MSVEAKRDPKVDPKERDVLAKNGREREVDEIYDFNGEQRVVYVGPDVCAPHVSLKSWRKWAAGATVIKKGND